MAPASQSCKCQCDCKDRGRGNHCFARLQRRSQSSLCCSRNTLILGHILAVFPLGLSAFFHFIAICTKIFQMYGDCTGTNVAAGFFSVLAIPVPIYTPTLLFTPLPVGLSNGSKLSEMPSIKMNEIPVKHMVESFLAKANNTCLNLKVAAWFCFSDCESSLTQAYSYILRSIPKVKAGLILLRKASCF